MQWSHHSSTYILKMFFLNWLICLISFASSWSFRIIHTFNTSPLYSCTLYIIYTVILPSRNKGMSDWLWEVINLIKTCWKLLLLSRIPKIYLFEKVIVVWHVRVLSQSYQVSPDSFSLFFCSAEGTDQTFFICPGTIIWLNWESFPWDFKKIIIRL